MKHLFVYGTLCPGQPNEHILKRIGGTWQAGHVRGRLYPNGWGAALGYPGIVLGEDGDVVEGYIFTSDQLEDNISDLDRFEGPGYRRVLTTIELRDKTQIAAYIYELSQTPG
ncbi:MAG: gamma-glutamylcyclotransferase family protein [Calditrichota bacterium]